MGLHLAPRQGDAWLAVARGRADYAADQGGPPSPDFQARGRYARAYGKSGGKLRYFLPASGLQRFLLFNTRRGIFRSAALRRAVNLALDRRAIAGPGAPDSLLIPPGMPGHRAQHIYGPAPDNTDEPGTDLHAVAQGHIAVTPLHFDLTDQPGIETLGSYDLARLLAPAAREVE